jgi:hypothetical protein
VCYRYAEVEACLVVRQGIRTDVLSGKRGRNCDARDFVGFGRSGPSLSGEQELKS